MKQLTRKQVAEKYGGVGRDWRRHENGGGWVYETATVAKTACVRDRAVVFGNAQIYGDAVIKDNASAYGHAQVYCGAILEDYARIYDSAQAYGFSCLSGGSSAFGMAQVYGLASVSDYAEVYDQTHVYGRAVVRGYSRIRDRAHVYGDTLLQSDSRVFGDSSIRHGFWKTPPPQYQGTRHFVSYCGDGYIKIGCEDLQIDTWIRGYAEILRKYDYTDAQIREYGAVIKMMAEVWREETCE